MSRWNMEIWFWRGGSLQSNGLWQYAPCSQYHPYSLYKRSGRNGKPDSGISGKSGKAASGAGICNRTCPRKGKAGIDFPAREAVLILGRFGLRRVMLHYPLSCIWEWYRLLYSEGVQPFSPLKGSVEGGQAGKAGLEGNLCNGGARASSKAFLLI